MYQGAPERFAVTYRFPKNFMLKELVYSKQTSSGAEFSTKKLKYADYGFYGVVSIKNKETNKYEKLFSSGKETKIINMSDYLDADGSLTLYYSVEYISSKNLEISVFRKLNLQETMKKKQVRFILQAETD